MSFAIIGEFEKYSDAMEEFEKAKKDFDVERLAIFFDKRRGKFTVEVD